MLTDERPIPIHLGAYPVDPGFPQLEFACDAVRMRDVFRTHLKPVPGRALEIVECAPFRYRCHQSATRCVLQYTLQISEPGNGRPRPQWVTGLIYAEPGEAEKVWRRMSAGNAGNDIPEEWRTFEPVSFIPELDMVVEGLPLRSPHAAARARHERRGPRSRAAPAPGPGPGRWQAGEAVLEPTRYRTELGAVLRYGVAARDTESGKTHDPRAT
jgi:hypothetical protein